MVKIYHNPRCSKSRQTLQILTDKNIEPEIIDYLNSPLDKGQLQQLTQMLNCSVREIMRTSEADYKDNGLKNNELSDDELFDSIVKWPKLLQRPIVVNGTKAAVGRPPESVLDIL